MNVKSLINEIVTILMQLVRVEPAALVQGLRTVALSRISW